MTTRWRNGNPLASWTTAAAMTVLLLVLPGTTHAQVTDGPPVGSFDDRSNASTPTLYARLGGYDFIARLVDTAFPRVAADPLLSRFFGGHSVDTQMRQRQLIVDAFCNRTGGPCFYTGRDLTAVHEGLGITDEDWDTFIAIIDGTLDQLEVPADERADLLRLFEERLRPTVVLD